LVKILAQITKSEAFVGSAHSAETISSSSYYSVIISVVD